MNQSNAHFFCIFFPFVAGQGGRVVRGGKKRKSLLLDEYAGWGLWICMGMGMGDQRR